MLLNYLPLQFTSDAFAGSTITLPESDSPDEISGRLRDLRRTHHGAHVFHRSGNRIHCIPLAPGQASLGTPATFTVYHDFQLANAVARDALLRFFHDANSTIVDLRPLTILLTDKNLASARPDVFGFYPEYGLDIRPLAPHEGQINSGVLIEFRLRQYFLKTAAELRDAGISVTGMYAFAPRKDPHLLLTAGFDREYLGRIETVHGNTATLSDAEQPTVDLTTCFVEANLATVDLVAHHLMGNGATDFLAQLREETFKITGAEHQLARLQKLGEWLEKKSPFACAPDLNVRIKATPHRCYKGNDAGDVRMLNTPTCFLRPGGSISAKWPIDTHIEQNGPYDAESFPHKHVRISLICPQEFIGDAEQFLGAFRDGIQSQDERAPFRQGFMRKYHLHKVDFSIHEVRSSGAPGEAYKTAALQALQTPPHLAIVIIRPQHADLPDEQNPYYVSKATLMAQGVPVQLMKIDTIRARNAYSLNTAALAMYAKLGGIPWVLQSNPELTHEIIVGIGSSILQKSRRGMGERVIGITTVFSGDGEYLLANSTKEVSMDAYIPALTQSLRETVHELRQRFGWQPRDRVRFIFHQSFKKYKEIEAAAVQDFAQSLTDFDVQYAFVHISDSHNWRLFDPASTGTKYGKKKGAMVPQRGAYVPLGPHTALVTLTGPGQLKNAQQGCPHPILVNVHEHSTFKSLDYLAAQVFNLSFMSWRTFNPATQPVSIAYSNMIVDLLSHLRRVKNWNPDALQTALRDKRWFL